MFAQVLLTAAGVPEWKRNAAGYRSCCDCPIKELESEVLQNNGELHKICRFLLLRTCTWYAVQSP